MRISTATDHFQARIDILLGDLQFVRCYLDDVLVITEHGSGSDSFARSRIDNQCEEVLICCSEGQLSWLHHHHSRNHTENS